MASAEHVDAGPHDSLPRQSIAISQQEQEEQSLSTANRELAAFLIQGRGYVVLRNALRLDLVDSLLRSFSEIYDDCRQTGGAQETGADVESALQLHVANKTKATFWFRKSRWRIFPRLIPPIGDPGLLANPFVIPILEDLLGRDLFLHFVSTDTCTKGALLQSPHSDINRNGVFADNRWKPRGFIVNVPVMECGLHNGPIELWPGGTHLWTSHFLEEHGLSFDIQDARNPIVERLAEYFPSVRLALQPGEVLIRDLAMWHRGTPNPTDEPRTMFTLGYFRRDFVYGYGDPSFNVDEALFWQLDPKVQKLYESYFSFSNRLRRRQQRFRSKMKRALLALARAR
ncbi:MAG TPA: phytanoyl-CoA dioxygenase family protein [Candidatus Acidoferrales bacterium]|nr:phytanoyl-CoA dioxygenase family protein [Candidatus Acidoferrales bacterium]